MEIVEKITLAAAILWVIWEFLSLIIDGVNIKSVFPARITWLPIFTISIVAVITFHQSTLHLIWLWALTFILGILATLLPWVQLAVLKIFLFLSAINILTELELEKEANDDQNEFFPEADIPRSKLVAMKPLFKGAKKEKPPGFG
jgi:hypothetical protein